MREILALFHFLTTMSPSSSHFFGGGSMDKEDSVLSDHPLKGELELPDLSLGFELAFRKGKSVQVEGTNVVRVPFGIRQSIKKRPNKPETWPTLVIPLQPLGSPPTPPQAA